MALEVEKAAVDFVGAGLGDDVDYPAGRAPELGAAAGGNHLELFDGVNGDVNLGALAARLLAIHRENDINEVLALTRPVSDEIPAELQAAGLPSAPLREAGD